METEKTLEQVEREIAHHHAAMEAWNTAYDRALNSDKKAGRPYDRHRYERVAHLARVKVLGACDRPKTCNKCPAVSR